MNDKYYIRVVLKDFLSIFIQLSSYLNSRGICFLEEFSSDSGFLVCNPQFWCECELFLFKPEEVALPSSLQVHNPHLCCFICIWPLGSCFAVLSLSQIVWESGWTKSVYKTMKDSTMTKRNSGKLVSCKCVMDFMWTTCLQLLDSLLFDG